MERLEAEGFVLLGKRAEGDGAGAVSSVRGDTGVAIRDAETGGVPGVSICGCDGGSS